MADPDEEVRVSKAQNWMFWFNRIKFLNASGHEFGNDFVFTPGFIAVNCARCGQGYQGRYSKEGGPYDYDRHADFVIGCDSELEITLQAEGREEAAR